MPSQNLHRVGIIAKSTIKKHKPLVQKIVKCLEKYEKEIYLDTNTASLLRKREGFSRKKILSKCDIAIVMGGDGTILKTARFMGYNPVLILGVNLGRVGFLTEVNPERMEKTLKMIFVDSKYSIDNRFILRVTIYRGSKKIKTSLALNEAVINQGAFARLIDLKTEINQRKVAHFRADGLIVSTPTGSTGHALSAGGPIVHYEVQSMIVTPICPAELANRAIVIPNDRQIKIIIETKRRQDAKDIGLTLDGQETLPLKYGDQIKIRKSGREFYFLRLSHSHYYKTLRSKLHWGG